MYLLSKKSSDKFTQAKTGGNDNLYRIW